MNLKFVDWGIANNFGEYIEIHKDLPKHPELYRPILNHELSHTDDKGFSWEDLKLDVKRIPNLNYWNLIKFMISRPKTWIQFLPVYYQRGKGIVYDLNQMIIASLFLTVISIELSLIFIFLI